MQEHMNQIRKTFFRMAAEYTEYVRREIDAANKKAASEKDGEDVVIHLGPAPVTIEDKVRTANLLMVTIGRMRRENGDRIPFGDLHVEAAKPGSVSTEDFVSNSATEAFKALGASVRDGIGVILTEEELQEDAANRKENAICEKAEDIILKRYQCWLDSEKPLLADDFRSFIDSVRTLDWFFKAKGSYSGPLSKKERAILDRAEDIILRQYQHWSNAENLMSDVFKYLTGSTKMLDWIAGRKERA